MRFHYPILAVAALRGRDGRLRAGSGIVAGVTVGLYAPLLESGNGSVLAAGVGLRLHCAADPLEHHSTDTFPGGPFRQEKPVLFQEGRQQLRTADAQLHAEEKHQPIYLDLAFSNAPWPARGPVKWQTALLSD
jgi:hypothetical protein